MKLQITDRKTADKIVSSQPSGLSALVSIYTPVDSRLAKWDKNLSPVSGFDAYSGPKIALAFDDASTPADGIFPPDLGDVQRLLDWAETVPYPAQGKILFHCSAGQARSASCALAFLSLKHGSGSEEKCVADVVMARRVAWFNDLIVELADNALGRDGSLLQAVLDWKARKKAVDPHKL